MAGKKLKLDLNKVKLIDNANNEYYPFGITPNQNKYNLEYAGWGIEESQGNYAKINLINASFNQGDTIFNNNLFIITPYNINYSTIVPIGSITFGGFGHENIVISVNEQTAYITISKAPSTFGIVYIVPKNSMEFKLHFDNIPDEIKEIVDK